MKKYMITMMSLIMLISMYSLSCAEEVIGDSVVNLKDFIEIKNMDDSLIIENINIEEDKTKEDNKSNFDNKKDNGESKDKEDKEDKEKKDKVLFKLINPGKKNIVTSNSMLLISGQGSKDVNMTITVKSKKLVFKKEFKISSTGRFAQEVKLFEGDNKITIEGKLDKDEQSVDLKAKYNIEDEEKAKKAIDELKNKNINELLESNSDNVKNSNTNKAKDKNLKTENKEIEESKLESDLDENIIDLLVN
ncbi:hypothetical protein WG909_06680 [Peptostreptococcaceae bacterium AGR-M142]